MKVVWTQVVIISLFLWPQDSWFGWKVEQPLLPKEALGSGACIAPWWPWVCPWWATPGESLQGQLPETPHPPDPALSYLVPQATRCCLAWIWVDPVEMSCSSERHGRFQRLTMNIMEKYQKVFLFTSHWNISNWLNLNKYFKEMDSTCLTCKCGLWEA